MSNESGPKLSQVQRVLLNLFTVHGDEIASVATRRLLPGQRVWAAPLFAPWIAHRIASLDAGFEIGAEWNKTFAQACMDARETPSSALDAFLKLRDACLTIGASKAEGLSGEWLFEEILQLTDPMLRDIVDLCGDAQRSALAAEQRKRRMMLEAITIPFAALDNEGCISAWNTAFIRVLGLASDKVSARELAHFCDKGAQQEIRKALRQRRSNAAREFTGGLLTGAKRFQPAIFRLQPAFDAQGKRDGLMVTIELRQASREDGSSFMAQTLNEMLRFIPLGLQVFDERNHVVFHSGTCGGIVEESDMAAQPLCCRLLAPEKDQCICRKVFQTGQAVQTEGPLSEAERMWWLRFVLVPLRDSLGQVTHVSCVAMDVSQRRGLEHQILEQQRGSSVAQVALSVAHEIRNPLGVMIGFAEMLSKGLPPDRIPRAVDKILQNGLRCKEIVEELLEFGQSTPGDRIIIPLHELIAEHVQPMFTAPQKRRIHWELPPPERAVEVECVPNQLAQVFVSLLDNALIFGQQVRVIAEVDEHCVVIRVEDDGPGVPEAHHERLFEPFFTTRKEAGGVGLGLSLSRSVINEYGGRLYHDAAAGPGACFVIELPRVQMEDHPGPEAFPPDLPKPAKARRLLIVDDEVDLVEMLDTVLRMHGFDIDTATTGPKALELLQSRTYDGAILDVQLPDGFSGKQLYDHICLHHPKLAAKTLFITADTMNFETRRFLGEIARPHLEKPFLVTDFAERVATLFD